ncbi:hypothetical protein F7725_027030, partial [Dissostichus mawsoni]
MAAFQSGTSMQSGCRSSQLSSFTRKAPGYSLTEPSMSWKMVVLSPSICILLNQGPGSPKNTRDLCHELLSRKPNALVCRPSRATYFRNVQFCMLMGPSQRSAAVVGPPGAPDPVVRDGHPAVLTLTHKQRVYHLLARAVIVWERPSTAHREGGLECPGVQQQ